MSEAVSTEDRIAALAAEVAEVKTLVEATAKSTAEIVEFWASVQGGIKVLGWLGKVAKFIGSIAAAASAVGAAYIYFTKGGPKP